MMSLNRPKPPGMAAVAALLAMDRTTLTAALKSVERRGRLVRLTPKGRRLLARAAPIWKNNHATVESLLGDGAADRLRESLRSLA